LATDRLRALEVFVAVVARGGFARAADALDTSPANVTRYVAELEAHLGTRLLHRTSRRVSLTEAGEAYYERARTILDEMAEAEAAATASASGSRGRLRINAPLVFGARHLAPLWPRFMALHPEVELDIADGLRRAAHDANRKACFAWYRPPLHRRSIGRDQASSEYPIG
jgi:DNA-binding transcriptional LysR family regulator